VCARDITGAADAAERHAQSIASLLIETRSRIAHSESQRAERVFAGLQPYGSELGSMPLEFAYAPIKALGPRTAAASARAKRSEQRN
jgi:hypothetical protein